MHNTKMNLSIGEIATQAGVRVEAVRYYEREGLISKARRAANGYRYFGEDTITQIRFIQSAQSLGFSLREIGELLALKADTANRCRAVRQRAQAKLTDIEQKIEALQRIRTALLPLLNACEPDNSINKCPILNALDLGEVNT